MKIRKATFAGAGLAGAIAVPGAAFAHGSSSGNGPNAVGLASSGTKLVRFDTDKPSKARSVDRVWGLTGDTFLVAIDRRVQNRRLYVGNKGGGYLLSSSSGRATKVGQLSVALSGTAFGVDFNPAANASGSSATPARICASPSGPRTVPPQAPRWSMAP